MFSNTVSIPKLSAGVERLVAFRNRGVDSFSRWMPQRPVLGIELRDHVLLLTCLRFGIGRPPLVLCGSIPGFERLTPAELGTRLRDFLAPLKNEEPAITLGVPRKDVVVRFLELPVTAHKSLPEAAALQVEMYKPNDDETFDWDATAVPQPEHLVATFLFAPHSKVEQLASRFSEAGFPLSQITTTQFAVLRLLLRCDLNFQRERHVVLDYRDSEAELALLDGRQLVYSHSFSLTEQESNTSELITQLHAAFSSLRWKENEKYSVHLVQEAPAPVRSALAGLGNLEVLTQQSCFRTTSPTMVSSEFTASAAVALASRTRHEPYSLNLLPTSLRQVRHHLRHLPTYILLALNIVALLAITLRVPVQNYVLLHEYRKEIASVRVRAEEMKQLLQAGRAMRQETLELDAFQQLGRLPLDALSEIAQKLPADAWINSYSYKNGMVELSGTAKTASPLVAVFETSSRFREVRFVGALSHDSSGNERFRLQMRVKDKP